MFQARPPARVISGIAKFLTLTGLLLFFFNNCGLVVPPKVDNMMLASVKYRHTGLEASCVACHEQIRPAPSNGTPHGNGADCIKCHNQNSWSQLGNFSHTPTPISCITCHLQDRPDGPVGNAYDHKRAGLSDCVSCHAQNAGKTWEGGNYSHSPSPLECISCHLNNRPTGPAGVKRFDHANGGTGDCVLCHKNPGVDWAGGVFSHTPAPVACRGCHIGKQPTSKINKMLHTSGVVVQDCAVCHKQPGTTWIGAKYHASISSQPTSCMDCHLSERPVGPVGTSQFNHANGGTGECVSCHKPGTTWKGGMYSHSPAPTTCIGCHLSKRPSGTVGNPPFNHANGGSGDCVSCHKQPGVTWAGGTFNHMPKPTTCKDCHLSKQPTTLIKRMLHSVGAVVDCAYCHKTPGTVWSGTKYHSNLPSQPSTCTACHTSDRPVGPVGTSKFDHAATGSGGMADCVGCHKNPGLSWTGGTIAHSPVPASCNSCHNPNRPATTKYPGSNTTVTGHYTTKDCYVCHRPKSATMTVFRFDHSNAVNANINFCLPCHLTDGQSEHRGENGIVFTGDGNCYQCHNKARKSWKR